MIKKFGKLFDRRIEYYVDEDLKIIPDAMFFWRYSVAKHFSEMIAANPQEIRAVVAAFQCEILQTGESKCPESGQDDAVSGEQVQAKAWDDYPGEKW